MSMIRLVISTFVLIASCKASGVGHIIPAVRSFPIVRYSPFYNFPTGARSIHAVAPVAARLPLPAFHVGPVPFGAPVPAFAAPAPVLPAPAFPAPAFSQVIPARAFAPALPAIAPSLPLLPRFLPSSPVLPSLAGAVPFPVAPVAPAVRAFAPAPPPLFAPAVAPHFHPASHLHLHGRVLAPAPHFAAPVAWK